MPKAPAPAPAPKPAKKPVAKAAPAKAAPAAAPVQQTTVKPKHHSHAGLWLLVIVFILATLVLVGVALFLFRGQMDSDSAMNQAMQEKEDAAMMLEEKEAEAMEMMEELEELKMATPPFAYTKEDPVTGFSIGVFMVDRVTGDEVELEIQSTALEGKAALFAIPQLGNENKIFVTRGPIDGDLPGLKLHGYDVSTGETTELDVDVGFFDERLSPDQGKMVVFSENYAGDTPDAYTDRDILVYDLLNNTFTSVGTLAAGQETDSVSVENRFAGLRESNVRWTSLDCFNLATYNHSTDPETGEFSIFSNGFTNYCVN